MARYKVRSEGKQRESNYPFHYPENQTRTVDGSGRSEDERIHRIGERN